MGYEEPYWWKPIEKALKEAYNRGKVDGLKIRRKYEI